MKFTRIFFVLLITLLLVNKSEQNLWGKIGKAFKRTGKAIGKSFERTGKTIGKGFVTLIKGCCGAHPSVCRHKKEVEWRKKEMGRTMNEINRLWTQIQSQGTWLKRVNDNNGVIYGHIQRITEQSTDAIKMLDPRIIIKLNDATNELKKGIQKHNATVMQFGIPDIENELGRTKHVVEENHGDLEVMGPEFKSEKMKKMKDDMFRLMGTKQITALLETREGKRLTRASSAMRYVLTTAKISRRQSYKRLFVSTMIKVNPMLKASIAILNTAELILKGYNAFVNNIKDVATCHHQRKQMLQKYIQIRREQNKMRRTLNQLKGELRILQRTRISLIEGTEDLRLMKELKLIEDIAKHNANSMFSKQAVAKIRTYKNGIQRSHGNIPYLQQILIDGLSYVKHTAECYKRKLATVQSIYRDCKQGLGSLDQLYIHAVFQFKPLMRKCIHNAGFAYTTKSSVMKLVREKSSKEFFEKNCLVNGVQQVLTCEDKHDGLSENEMVSKFKVDLKTIRSLTGTCGSPTLSPRNVCKLKQNRLAATTISSIFLVSRSSLQTMYNRC